MNKKYFIMVEDGYTLSKRRLLLSENDLLSMKVFEVEDLEDSSGENLVVLEHKNVHYVTNERATKALISRKKELEQQRKDLILK